MEHQSITVILFLAFISFSHQSIAQHAQAEGAHHGIKGSHRLTLGLGHTSVSQGIIDDETRWLSLPSWSLNYDYWLSDKWAVGLQNDVIVEKFTVTDHDDEEFERSYPLSVIPVAIYKLDDHWSFVGGVGREFSEGHNLTLTRLGIESGWHLPGNWEAGIALVWDNKWNYYNSWGISFTASKIWPKKYSH